MTALQHRLAQQQDDLHAQGLAKAESAARLSALEGDMDFLKQEQVAALAENAELQARLACACLIPAGARDVCFSVAVKQFAFHPHRQQCSVACLSVDIMEGARLRSRWQAGPLSRSRCV